LLFAERRDGALRLELLEEAIKDRSENFFKSVFRSDFCPYV
jgi:hypothetical protein